jgi:hypothetical protein
MKFITRWRSDRTGQFMGAEKARKLSRALVSKVKLWLGRKP